MAGGWRGHAYLHHRPFRPVIPFFYGLPQRTSMPSRKRSSRQARSKSSIKGPFQDPHQTVGVARGTDRKDDGGLRQWVAFQATCYGSAANRFGTFFNRHDRVRRETDPVGRGTVQVLPQDSCGSFGTTNRACAAGRCQVESASRLVIPGTSKPTEPLDNIRSSAPARAMRS